MRTIVLVAALALSGCSSGDTTIDDAMTAYSQNKVTEAESIFSAIARNDAASPHDKAQARRELARIAWLVDGNAGKSLSILRGTDAAGDDGCEIAKLEARVLGESHRRRELLVARDRIAARCAEPSEADEILLEALDTALQLARNSGADGRAIGQAQAILNSLGEDARTGLRGSALSLELALLEHDAAAALQSWKNYFWLSDSDLPQGMRSTSPPATTTFTAGLADGASPADQLRLVDLLVRAGFARPAEAFARSVGLVQRAGAHPLWRKAAAYFDTRARFEATLLASNRRVARGGKASDLKAAAREASTRLMQAIGASGDPRAPLRAAYGLYGTVGETGGFASVHMGHVVQDERRIIEQYGHRASVAFIAVDNMISNGFESWLWDGSAAAGGWTDAGPTIVQVRPEYTSGPLTAWSVYSGGAGRKRLMERMAREAAADIAALKAANVAFLPGLSDRLRLQVAQQVGSRAQAALAPGRDMRRAFLAEYWRATFQQSILTHEGRHALDRTLVRGLARLSDSNLEYRAKLSELALADYPRLALLNIDDRTIGGGTAHGKANERVLRGYADWIAKNSKQVRGFDPRIPPLAQVDRLSDEQLRLVARSLDPIAR